MAIAKIIIVGDEILRGEVVEKNSCQILFKLNDLGITVRKISIVSDEKERLISELKEGLENADLTIVSGGLGVTPDDITKDAVIEMFSLRTYLDEALLTRIENHYQRLNKPMPDAAMKQALIPKGAIVLENTIGFAPGLIIKQGKKFLALLPGVPEELKKILETGLTPFLESTLAPKPIFYRLIRTTNISESELMERIGALFKKKFKEIKVGYYPAHLGVDIKISTEKDKKLLSLCEKEIVARIKNNVYGFNSTTLEERVGELLRKKKCTLSVAESCTGGLIGNRITDVPGSSDYFIGGVVAYSNEIKTSVLGVKEKTLEKYGAVSKETVSEMAVGIKDYFKTDIGLAVSGVAGPKGSEKKPVGLVYIGLAWLKKVITEEHHFTGPRKMIKEQSAQAALDLLRRTLES